MPRDGSGGFLLSLLTESFAVRALIGSVAAAALAMLLVRRDLVRHRAARRLTVLAPVLVAAGAALAVAQGGGVYLPQLWLTSQSAGPAGQIMDLLGELRAVSPRHGVDVLVAAYLVTAGVLLSRRVLGQRRLRQLLSSASDSHGYGRLVPVLHRLSERMQVRIPRLLMVPDCPGGAFTAGLRHPVIALDPVLADRLDERELEGLLAHELAHLKRGDNFLAVALGVFRDLVFFLPPVHVAQRWLSREQEESADELASEHTGRPVALASSIVKVWDRHREQGQQGRSSALRRQGFACAALGAATAPAKRASSQALTSRVERLIERPTLKVTSRRRRVEGALAVGLVAAGGLAAWLVPAWIARDLNAYSLSFVYLAAPVETEVESPAFATFRALTPQRAPVSAALTTGNGLVQKRALRDPGLCPCLESTAQLRSGEFFQAEASPPRMLWRTPGQATWDVGNARSRTALRSRPLLALTDSGPQMGFFLVGRSSPTR